jgi:hypothetical protein
MNKVCIVGSADSLTGKGLGEKIDNHDIIIRINQPHISGFEKDVGSRVTHCFIAPWQIVGFTPNKSVCRRCHSKMANAISREKSILIEDCFNRLKLEDNGTIVLKDTTEGPFYDFHGFYKEISNLINSNIKFSFINISHRSPKWKKRGFSKSPTSGTLLIEYYRKLYGNVDIAGFGHPINKRQDDFYHYWDINKEDSLKRTDPHDINIDIMWLQKLHKKNKINILELNENNNTF